MKWLFKLDRALGKGEIVVIAVFLISMIVFYSLQTILRNFFGTAIQWIDPLVYNLLLWIALIGGSLATLGERNITIDISKNLLPERFSSKIAILTNAAAAVISWFLASASLDYITDMKADGLLESDYLPLPLWVTKIILPIGFYMICFRFTMRALERICVAVGIDTGRPVPTMSPKVPMIDDEPSPSNEKKGENSK